MRLMAARARGDSADASTASVADYDCRETAEQWHDSVIGCADGKIQSASARRISMVNIFNIIDFGISAAELTTVLAAEIILAHCAWLHHWPRCGTGHSTHDVSISKINVGA